MVTREDFAKALLKALGAPRSRFTKQGKRNRRAIVAWQAAEGTTARFNPLATTLPRPGATDFNSVGVKNYVSFAQGVEATAHTLLKSDSDYGYGAIVGRLRDGVRAESTLAAIEGTSWGTGGLALKVLQSWLGHSGRYAAAASQAIGQ